MPLFTTIYHWWICVRILVIGLITTSCLSENISFNDLPEGGKWRLLAFNDERRSLDSVKVIHFDATVLDFRSGDTVNTFYNTPFTEGKDYLWSLIKQRYTGDSLEVIASGSTFLREKAGPGDTSQYFIRIGRTWSEADQKAAALRELVLLDSLIRSDSVRTFYHENQGIYLRRLMAGDTVNVTDGREVVLHYTGYTPDGNIFDDSRRMDGPMRFVMGNEDQVLPGIEIALSQMTNHETVRAIIPSWLAFRGKGSAGNRVPPFTTVVYELEVMALGN